MANKATSIPPELAKLSRATRDAALPVEAVALALLWEAVGVDTDEFEVPLAAFGAVTKVDAADEVMFAAEVVIAVTELEADVVPDLVAEDVDEDDVEDAD
jgi:hypothetical protein